MTTKCECGHDGSCHVLDWCYHKGDDGSHDCECMRFRSVAEPEPEPPPSRTPVQATVRINAYRVIADAVERACEIGARRAFKHTDRPTEEDIARETELAVMNELSDVLDYGPAEDA